MAISKIHVFELQRIATEDTSEAEWIEATELAAHGPETLAIYTLYRAKRS